MKRVFVTGLGAVTPIGIGIEAFTEALKSGKNGINSISSFDASQHSSQMAGEISNLMLKTLWVRKNPGDTTDILNLVWQQQKWLLSKQN